MSPAISKLAKSGPVALRRVMALKSPLMPSPTGGVSSAFSPYTDSPHSPAAVNPGFAAATSRHSTRSVASLDYMRTTRIAILARRSISISSFIQTFLYLLLTRLAMWPFFHSSNSTNTRSDSSLAPPPSPYPTHVDPSPVDSNGTENTEIEDSAQSGSDHGDESGEEVMSPDNEPDIVSPASDAVSASTLLCTCVESDFGITMSAY